MPVYRNETDDGMVTVEGPEAFSSVPCVGCGLTVEESEGFMVSSGMLCNNCHGVCPDCDADFNLHSGHQHAIVPHGIVCGRCTRNSYIYCENCQEWDHRDNCTYIPCEGCYRCDPCLNDGYIFCEECDEWNCERCYESCDSRSGSNFINDYSYRPNPLHFHALPGEIEDAPLVTHEMNRVMRTYAKVPFMGFELEVECEGGSSKFFEGAQSLSGHDDLIYLKQDGSINYGFEIVTHPMTMAWAMDNFPWAELTKLSNLGFTAWSNTTCGLHVHVSRDGFSGEAHQARFIHFIVRNSDFMEFFAGRSSSRWSSFDREQLRNLKEKVRSSYHTDRYMAVNTNNPGTLEVRIFNASLSAERVRMCLQLVNAIVCYTEGLTAKDFIQGKGFADSTFVDWVKYHHDTYDVLVSYLNEWYVPFLNGSRQIGE